MTAVGLLLFVVAVSLGIVRLAAVALELTGLPWEEAKFHALSAFSNTGYPARASEDLFDHPVRRRIIAYLIVLGNAGLIATVASLAGSLLQGSLVGTLRNLGMIVVGVGAIVWLAHQRWLGGPLRHWATARIEKRYGRQPAAPAELLQLAKGYRLLRLPVAGDAPVVDQSLRALRLKQQGLQVLGIERAGAFLPMPDGEEVLRGGDIVVAYVLRPGAEELFWPPPPPT